MLFMAKRQHINCLTCTQLKDLNSQEIHQLIGKKGQQMLYKKLKTRYMELFPKKGINCNEIEALQQELGVVFPEDLNEILTYFDGYHDVGHLSLFTFQKGSNWSVSKKTKFFRKKIGLPNRYLVLKEGDESFIVLETQDTSTLAAPVYWIGLSDVDNLVAGKSLIDDPIVYKTFADFFEFLLDEERAEREEEEKED